MTKQPLTDDRQAQPNHPTKPPAQQELSQQELWEIRAVNTHCHNLLPHWFEDITLHRLLQMTYVSWIVPDAGDTPQGHRFYFDEMGANSYFRWWKQGVEALHGGGETLTPESWDAFDERVRQAYSSPGHNLSALREKCAYDAILLDDYMAPGSCHGAPELMRPVFRCDMFLCGHAPGKTDENHNHAYDFFPAVPASLAEYEVMTEQAVARAVQNGAVGLKIAIAYERPLDFRPGTRAAAERAFGDSNASPEDIRAFGDHMMFFLANVAAKLDVPIQIHTGLGGMDGSRAIGLQPLIHANPATRFDLFHASYPWCADVLGLAHKYPNVYLDLCWLPLISTARAQAFLREALELVNAGRLLWGCDTWTCEESMGARLAAHRCILDVLNGFIREGILDHAQALACARGILRENAARLYRLF